MDYDKKVSLAVIKRLPKYYRYLGDLLDNNVTRISSKELSKKMNATPSQIRQDLNNFGCFGQQGYGYDVSLLYSEIKTILGLDKTYSVIVVGAGNLGNAILNYTQFQKRGVSFAAIFDTDAQKIGTTINGVEIKDIKNLGNFLEQTSVDIAVLCVPKSSAAEVAKVVIKGGVKSIWNFTPLDLENTKDVVVENVHLSDSLMTLFYKLNEGFILERYVKK